MPTTICDQLARDIRDKRLRKPWHRVAEDAPPGLYVHPDLIGTAKCLSDRPVYSDPLLPVDDWYIISEKSANA